MGISDRASARLELAVSHAAGTASEVASLIGTWGLGRRERQRPLMGERRGR